MKSYFSKQQRKSTVQKNKQPKGIDNNKISEFEDIFRRKTFSGSKNQNKLTQIPILKPYDQQKLDFSHNIIKKIQNIEHYKNLKILNLSFNRLTRIQGIFMLKKIQELNLSNNLLQNIPQQFKVLKTLKYLYLHNNKISQYDQLDNLKLLKITKITLQGNPIAKTKDFKKTIQKILKNLIYLDKTLISNQNKENLYETPYQISPQQNNTYEKNSSQYKTCERNINITQDEVVIQEENANKRIEQQKEQVKDFSEISEPKLTYTQRLNRNDSIINSYRSQLQKYKKKSIQIRIENQQKKFNENIEKLILLINQKKQKMNENIMHLQKIKLDIQNCLLQQNKFIQNIKTKVKQQDIQNHFILNYFNKLLEFISKIQLIIKLEEQSICYILNCSQLFNEPNERMYGMVKQTKKMILKRQEYQNLAIEAIKQLQLLSLQLINYENEIHIEQIKKENLNIVNESKIIVREFIKFYNRIKKNHNLYHSYWVEFLNQMNHFIQIISLKENKQNSLEQRQNMSELKKLLFSSNRQVESNKQNLLKTQQYKVLSEKCQMQNERIKQLQQKISQMQQNQVNQQRIIKQQNQKSQIKINQLIKQRNEISLKWQNLDLFNKNIEKLYQNISSQQSKIIQMMKEKLSSDFFQNILLNQSITIQQLLKSKKQIQNKYLNQLKKQRTFNKYQATLKIKHNLRGDTQTATGNPRYPDSTNIAGVSSAESNLIQQQQQKKYKNKGKNVSQFVINGENQSARFQSTLGFQNQSKQKLPIDYFRKSMGFSFKKNSNINKQRISTLNAMSGTKSKKFSAQKIESEYKQQPLNTQQFSSAKCMKQKQNLLSKRKMFGLNELVDRRSKQYYEINLEQGESYKNYIKYHLRNNIIEILSNHDVHPNLKGRYNKDEIKHYKYHTLNGPKLINKQKSYSLDKFNRSINN